MIAALYTTVDTVSMILTISIRIISSVVIRMIARNIATIDILLTFLVLGSAFWPEMRELTLTHLFLGTIPESIGPGVQ